MMIMHGYSVCMSRHRATDILGYIYYYYANRVLASLCPNFTNFVAMATKIWLGKISLAAFDGPAPKTPARRKHLTHNS